jgi:hypothetical protein
MLKDLGWVQLASLHGHAAFFLRGFLLGSGIG